MIDCNIVTLCKNKRDRIDCNSYRRISQLGMVGKIFARVVLNRLQKVADRVLSRVLVWLLIKALNNRHGVLLASVTGELQRAEAATVHCLH